MSQPTPHPLFIAAHASMCNAGELVDCGVSAQRLLALYPVEVNSYRALVLDFFKRQPDKLVQIADLAESYQLTSASLPAVEDLIALSIYDSEEYLVLAEAVSQVAAAVGQLAEEVTDRHRGDIYIHAATALKYQLEFLVRSMLLLSNWPESALAPRSSSTNEEAAQKALQDFLEGAKRMLSYYNLCVRFATS